MAGFSGCDCLASLEGSLSEQMSFACAEDYAETRVSTLRKAMRAAGAQKDASLPVAFIENSSHCSTNTAGEKVIGPNKDRRWLPELMAQVLLLSAAPSVKQTCILQAVHCCSSIAYHTVSIVQDIFVVMWIEATKSTAVEQAHQQSCAPESSCPNWQSCPFCYAQAHLQEC